MTRVSVATAGVLLVAVASMLAAQDSALRPLHEAAAAGDLAQLKQYIAKGANLNELDVVGSTPLGKAVEFGQFEAAKLLIEGKANINAKNRDGRTPLLLGLMRGDRKFVDLLLANGADVKVSDNQKRTALHMAARLGVVDIAEALVKAGADVNAADVTGQTPLVVALQANRTEMAAFLRQSGAKEPPTLSMYGDYEPGAQGTAGQAAAPSLYAPRAQAIEIDPNAIREEMKKFEGLAAAIEALDGKSDSEQRGWVQRRTDNRATLLMAGQRQFEAELALVKKTADEEKAAKTGKAVDELAAARKKRVEAISGALRDQRREALQNPSSDTFGRGRGRTPVRATRGRSGDAGAAGTSPYGAAGAKMPPRRGADANEPVLDAETQAQMQAWLSARPEDKKTLLDAVHRQDVADLSYLQEVAAEEEQAKKTNATIMALLMVRQQRVQNIEQKWKEEDERQQKLQERYGPGGVPGRGLPQDNQTGTRRPTRRR